MRYGLYCLYRGKSTFFDASSKCIKFESISENNTLSIKITSHIDGLVLNSAVIDSYAKGEEVLENSWLQAGDSFFRKANKSTPRNRFFLVRDQNPNSFDANYGYKPKSIVSEWFTIIKGKTVCQLIGAVTTKDQFVSIQTKAQGSRLSVRVMCQFDGLRLDKGQSVNTERIAYLTGKEPVIKSRFNSLLRRYMGIEKSFIPISGVCCPYYWNADRIDESIAARELESIRMDIDYFQIDDGYCVWGDWLDHKRKFPNLKAFADKIKAKCIKPGIWIAPFMADPRSRLYKTHRDWFIDVVGAGRYTSPFDFMPGLDYKVLDPQNNESMDYLKEVFLHLKKIGFKLFKIDFVYPICMSNFVGKTRAQVLREAFMIFRGWLGDDIHIMSAISQLSPLVGIVDSARLGVDTLYPKISRIPLINKINDIMLAKNLRTCNARGFLDIWAKDPDVVSFESSKLQRDSQIDFIRKFDANLWIGDELSRMKDDRWDYFRKIRP